MMQSIHMTSRVLAGALNFRDMAAGGVHSLTRLLAWALLAWGAVLLTGCATVANPDPRDPLESYNRGMTNFNEQVDALVLKPVATAYKDVTPAPVRTGVRNFFANIGDAWSFVNNVLQLRGEAAVSSLVRFNVNTLFGLGGVLDVASEMGIDRYQQDLGLTLGRWGVRTGPYLVLPILGPSTVRDAIALPVDMKGNLVRYVDPVAARNSLYALRLVEARANVLRAGAVLDAAALDKYSFTRDAYLQVRSRNNAARKTDGTLDDDYDDGAMPPEPAK